MLGVNRDEARAAFAKNFLFASLSDSDVDGLLTYARIARYRAGGEIFAKGSPGLSLMAVLDGTVQISSGSESGREVILNLIHRGEIFGEIALLDGRERSADAIAMTDCELLVLHRRDFIPFLERRPEICVKFIELLCRRLRNTSEQVEELSFWHLESRLAKALLRLADDTPRPGGAAIAVRITQRELGNLVGGSREHVNKHLQTWQRSGVIELGKGVIVIRDRAAISLLV